MSFTATTITEHYLNEGKIKGKIEGKIENIEELYRFGILSKEQMEKMIEPLKQQLQSLESSEKKHIH
jgi:predicted AlkP superfamily phosphohydrolase/phosphomutase